MKQLLSFTIAIQLICITFCSESEQQKRKTMMKVVEIYRPRVEVKKKQYESIKQKLANIKAKSINLRGYPRPVEAHFKKSLPGIYVVFSDKHFLGIEGPNEILAQPYWVKKTLDALGGNLGRISETVTADQHAMLLEDRLAMYTQPYYTVVFKKTSEVDQKVFLKNSSRKTGKPMPNIQGLKKTVTGIYYLFKNEGAKYLGSLDFKTSEIMRRGKNEKRARNQLMSKLRSSILFSFRRKINTIWHKQN